MRKAFGVAVAILIVGSACTSDDDAPVADDASRSPSTARAP
ncbi:MAG: hypothetical protein ACRDLB_00300 [Actinomycetota bacterium]